MRLTAAASVALLGGVFAPLAAQGSCGLQECPSPRSASGSALVLQSSFEQVGFDWNGASGVVPSFHLDAQSVLDGENEGRTFLSADVALTIPLRDAHRLVPRVRFPLQTRSRFDWTAGLGLRTSL